MSEEVRTGYKRTEVGMIPEEWEVSILDECCRKITDGTHDTPKPVKKGVPFLTAIHVKNNGIAYEECLYLSQTDHDLIYKRCNPENGDVLMVNIGAGVSTTATVEVDFEFSLKNVALLKPDPGRLTGRYLNYCLTKKKESITQALLTGGAQPFLSLAQICQIKIPLPPSLEQRAIAEALSDVDALLGALDRLIAKKRDLKQAAMQQLLTGQTRLPGFHGEWEVKTIDQVGFVTSGKRLPLGCSLVEHSTPHPYVRVTDMRPGTVSLSEIKFVSETVFPVIKRYRIFCEDIFISVAGSLGIVGKVPKELDGANLTENANRITNITCSQDFLMHVLMSPLIQNIIDTIQTVGAQPKLALTRIRKFIISLPPFFEQTAIAAVLSDMDTELTALEQRRNKTQALKQGMMQELLTGKTRLLDPGGCHA